MNAEKCTWHADAFCLLTDLAHVSLLSNHISPEALMKEAGEKKKKAGHDLWLTVEVQALKRIHFFIIKTPPSVMRDTSKHFIQ